MIWDTPIKKDPSTFQGCSRKFPTSTNVTFIGEYPRVSVICPPTDSTNTGKICGLSLLLVLSFAPRGFSPGTQVFPSPLKPRFSNSSSTKNQVDEEPLPVCGYATSKSLFIVFIYLFNEFRISLYPDWQIDNGFVKRPIMVHTQILVHRWGPRTRTSVVPVCDVEFSKWPR